MSKNPALELYRRVMTELTENKEVGVEDFDAAALFAKASKRKAPRRGDAWACGITVPEAPEPTPIKQAKTAKAVKAPTVKKVCGEDGCTKDSYCKGLCAQHYTAHRRQDPAERVKANLASKVWREKKAATQAAAQASE